MIALNVKLDMALHLQKRLHRENVNNAQTIMVVLGDI